MQKKLLEKLQPLSDSIYTEWKDFKEKDMDRFQSILEERLTYLSEDFLRFKSCEKVFVPRSNERLSNFFNTDFYKLTYELVDEETGELEEASIHIACPLLIKGNEFIMGGSRFSLVLSLAPMGHIHSKKKVIFKLHDQMLVLETIGKPAFLLPKRLGIFSAFLLTSLKNEKSFESIVRLVLPGAKIVDKMNKKEESMIPKNQLIKFSDFAIITPPIYDKTASFYFKSLESLKRNKLAELSDYPNAYIKIAKQIGSPTSRKVKSNIEDTIKFINEIGIETIMSNVSINIHNKYNDTQLSIIPVFVDTLIDNIHKTFAKQILSYKNSPVRKIDKLRRVLNETVLFDVIINGLYKDSRLRYIDNSNAFQQQLLVSLTRQSGQAVSSGIRNITEDYKNKLALHVVVAGKSAGLSSSIAPI